MILQIHVISRFKILLKLMNLLHTNRFQTNFRHLNKRIYIIINNYLINFWIRKKKLLKKFQVLKQPMKKFLNNSRLNTNSIQRNTVRKTNLLILKKKFKIVLLNNTMKLYLTIMIQNQISIDVLLKRNYLTKKQNSNFKTICKCL